MAVQMRILARGDSAHQAFFGYYRDLRAQLDFIMLGGDKFTKCASASAEPVAMVWASKCNVQRFRRRAQNLRAKLVGTICHRSDFDLPTPVIGGGGGTMCCMAAVAFALLAPATARLSYLRRPASHGGGSSGYHDGGGVHIGGGGDIGGRCAQQIQQWRNNVCSNAASCNHPYRARGRSSACSRVSVWTQ